MTRDELLTLVLNRLGNRAGDDTLRDASKLELNFVQRNLELEEELPWFLQTPWSNSSTCSQEVTLPGDFISEVEDAHVYLTKTDGDEVALTKDDFDALKNRYGNKDPQRPVAYALMRDSFWFFPAPDQEYTIRMMYYAHDVELSDAVQENRWTAKAPEWLLGELGVILSTQYVKDSDTAKMFADQALRGKRRALNASIGRAETNVSRSWGD